LWSGRKGKKKWIQCSWHPCLTQNHHTDKSKKKPPPNLFLSVQGGNVIDSQKQQITIRTTLERIVAQQFHHNSRSALLVHSQGRMLRQTPTALACLPASQCTETHHGTGARVPRPLSHVIIRLNELFFSGYIK
jgi:hypothetical protein